MPSPTLPDSVSASPTVRLFINRMARVSAADQEVATPEHTLLVQLRQLMEAPPDPNSRRATRRWLRAVMADEKLRATLLEHIRRTESAVPSKDWAGWISQAQFLLDGVRIAILVVDENGRPLVVNRRGREILTQRDGLSLQNDRLAANSSADTAELRQAIAAATRRRSVEPNPTATVIALKRHSTHRSLIVSVRPVPRAADDSSIPNSAYLLVCDPEVPGQVQPDWLRSLYGLTPTEARLAAELANSTPLEEAAEKLGITVGTARVHLKHIFSKTQTGRQSELIHLLLSSGIGILN